MPKKIYANDTSLILLNSLNTNELLRKLFENLVYLDLRRQGKQVFYFVTKGGFEIDFVTIAPDKTRELIQVCWDVSNDSTREREERALQEASKELGLAGRIITPWNYLKGGL